MPTKCFFIEPIERGVRSLRRYNGSEICTINRLGYHDAEIEIERFDMSTQQYGMGTPKWNHDDARWPLHCACGYPFQPGDEWQMNEHRLYVRKDTGQTMTIQRPAVGAMWYADWYLEHSPEMAGPDGHVLAVMTPGGPWVIDGQARNCTMPQDDKHKCWVRHGTPPNITVDKNGPTCAAGAGSIQAGGYHGFLRNGELT